MNFSGQIRLNRVVQYFSSRSTRQKILFARVVVGGWMAACFVAGAQNNKTSEGSSSTPPTRQWKDGPFTNENLFPIGVWLQNPANAARYRSAGINLYVALWRGPTTNQLAELEKAGVSVICSQNRAGLENKDNPIIVGWMHGDEPDNAQSRGRGEGYGPPILPEVIVKNYERMRAADPSRPILLNLGQGVAWDN